MTYALAIALFNRRMFPADESISRSIDVFGGPHKTRENHRKTTDEDVTDFLHMHGIDAIACP